MTPDERRRVASMARNGKVAKSFVGPYGCYVGSETICGCMVIGHTDEDVHRAYDFLADLIDPTCEVVGSIHNESIFPVPDWWEHKLSCGHYVRTEWPEPPKYCDQCGRRVEGGRADGRTEDA